MKSEATDDIARRIINQLKGKVIIHRYDAFSTHSIYLKFDYGVANSLRISDHPGYNHLSYRFNIIVGLKRHYLEKGKYIKEFFPESQVDEVIALILKHKAEREARYQDYDAVLEQAKKRELARNIPFWQCCKEVSVIEA